MSALLISKGLDLIRKVPPSRPLRKAKRGETASGNPIGAEKRLARNGVQPRTRYTTNTPISAETIPAIRSGPSAISSTVVIARLAPPGNAARKIPSITKHKPSAAKKSCISANRFVLFRRSGRGRTRSRTGLCRCFARRIAEVAEEIGVRTEHQIGITLLHASLVSLHRAIKAKEIRIAGISVGEDPVALGIALTADGLGLLIGLGDEYRDVAIGLGLDFLTLLAALGAEFGGFALPFGLHALEDCLAVLFRQIDAADTHIDHMNAERLRIAIELIAHLPHQLLAPVTNRVGKRRRTEHTAQRRVEQNRKLRGRAVRPHRLIEFQRVRDAIARKRVDHQTFAGLTSARDRIVL